MLTKLIIRNYKAVVEAEIPLGPFTVLVGPNDSGKSTVLKALETLYRCTEPNLQVDESGDRCVVQPSVRDAVRNRDPDNRLQLEVEGTTDGLAWAYRIGFSIDGKARVCNESLVVDEKSLMVFRYEGKAAIRDGGQMRETEVWYADRTLFSTAPDSAAFPLFRIVRRALATHLAQFRPDQLARPSVLSAENPPRIDRDGLGLSGVVDELLSGSNVKMRLELEEDLRRISPNVRGLAVRTVATEKGAGKQLHFELKGTSEATMISAENASDGLVLTAGFLALSRTVDASVLLIDEPENGLHPRALGFIVGALRRITTGEVGGRPRQLVMTTHSPILLNFIEPSEVLVVTRDADGVRFTPITAFPQFEENFQDFDLGELWYNLGEEALVK